MSEKSWKAYERRIAKLFPSGQRRGADFRGDSAGKSDIISPGWAPECKLLARPSFGQLLGAARQAETNAKVDEIPIAIVKRKNDRDVDSLVVFRLETFYRLWLKENQ